MNKAKMTFRFSQDRKPEERSRHRDSKVVPLHAEEYRVVEEPVHPPDRAAQVRGVWTDELRTETSEQPSVASSATEAGLHTGGVKPLNDYTTDYGGWQSSFDEETSRVEEMIRSSREAAVHPENGYTRRDQPDYEPEDRQDRKDSGSGPGYRPAMKEPIEPDRDSRYGYGGGHVRITRPPGGGGSFLRIAASVAGAVVTGVAFGFLVLSMFSAPEGDQAAQVKGGKPEQQKSAQASAGGQAGAAKPGAGVSGAGSVPATAGAGVAVSLPARSYTILQGGVFSTAQSAETEVGNFRKKGLSAVSEAGDKYTVFVGVAGSRDESLGLSQTYKDKQIDVMLKPYEIPAVSHIRWTGKQPELFATYMNQGSKLVQLIAAQTSLHVVDKEPKPLDEKALQTIKTTHQSWSQSASTISDGLGEAGRTALPKLNSALNTAVVTLEEYKKNPSTSLMWQAQTAIMQYLVAEKDLLKSIAVS